MQRQITSTPDRKDFAPGHDDRMGVYTPFVWLAVWIVRIGLRVGVISPEFLMPSRPKIAPTMFFRNRQLRRARASCLRRARRCAIKHGKVNASDYTPRAYAHFAYLDRMNKAITPAQFKEHFLRDTDVSRVQVYDMDSAHEITSVQPGTSLSGALTSLASRLAAALCLSPLNLAAPADPAPP